jgi:hypothetical protein
LHHAAGVRAFALAELRGQAFHSFEYVLVVHGAGAVVLNTRRPSEHAFHGSARKPWGLSGGGLLLADIRKRG